MIKKQSRFTSQDEDDAWQEKFKCINTGTKSALGTIYPKTISYEAPLARRYLERTIHSSLYDDGFHYCCMLMKYTNNTYDAILYCSGEGYPVAISCDEWQYIEYHCMVRKYTSRDPAMFNYLCDHFIEKGWISLSLSRRMLEVKRKHNCTSKDHD